ncbi:MAG: hypothetical protein AAGF30_07635 [Pseudomonadota bacterium]
MRFALLLALTLAAACGRPLTQAETALLQPLHGDTLDTARVRIVENPIVGAFPITFDARPRVTCRERIGRPREGRIVTRTAGLVLFNRVFTSSSATRDDYAAPLPGGALDLPTAMFLVHEATHIWQWQNRDITDFHPVKVFSEQIIFDDPYLFEPGDHRPFLDQSYEIQASLVEEYLCCATLDPQGARTLRLRDQLRQAMPVAEPSAFARDVYVPYTEDLDGICA